MCGDGGLCDAPTSQTPMRFFSSTSRRPLRFFFLILYREVESRHEERKKKRVCDPSGDHFFCEKYRQIGMVHALNRDNSVGPKTGCFGGEISSSNEGGIFFPPLIHTQDKVIMHGGCCVVVLCVYTQTQIQKEKETLRAFYV